MSYWKSLFAAALISAPTYGLSQSPVDIGSLSCASSDVKNRIVSTTMEFDCTFTRTGGREEKYVGKIRRVGVDLSAKDDVKIIWTVAVAGDATAPESLAGKYVGVAADVSAGVGGGARILVGGGDNSVSLSPTSFVGVEGTGFSIGLEEFTLESAS